MPATPNHPGDDELVAFQTAGSPMEAAVIASVLRDAGIPTYVGGSQLSDEFAVSQRLMGLNAVRIQVPRSRLGDAEAALAEAREASRDVEAIAEASVAEATIAEAAGAGAPPAPASPKAGRNWLLPLLLGVAAVTFLINWLDTRVELRAAQQTALTSLDPAAGDELVWRWRDTGQIASRSTDRNGNGIPETWSAHNRAGRLLQTAYDADENGMPEKVMSFDASGQVATIVYDADQDGVPELVEEYRGGNHRVAYIDADQDGRHERIEQRDRNGNVTRAWGWSDEGGFAVVK